MDSFISYIETTEQLELFAAWYEKYYDPQLYKHVGSNVTSWITQYNTKSFYTALPAWIGLNERAPTHNSVTRYTKEQVYSRYYANLPVISIEAIVNPDAYPEYYI